MTLTAKHAQLLKSNRALLLAFESLPQVAKLSAVGLALTLGICGGAMALKGTASDRVQICLKDKQALRCKDKSGRHYLMTKYHAEQWKANGIPGEIVFQKTIPATNPHKALWMLLSAAGFGIASAGFRSLQNSERQLANYEAIAEKRDLAKGEMNARVELLESFRNIAIGEVHLQADLEAVANDRAVILSQCEVLGEADIKIAAMDAEEAVFEAETAGLSDEKKREYMDFLRSQKTPFLLNGTQTLDSINNPSDKVGDGDGAAIEPTDGPQIPQLTWYPSVLVYGAPGSGKTTFADKEVGKRLAAGHKITVLDPHAAYGAWQGCEVIGGGMNYDAINAKLAWFTAEIKRRYERVQNEPNPKFKPLTFVCDEFTHWGSKCENSAAFFEEIVTDIRKVEMLAIIISHTRTLAGLANAKGFAKLRDEALLEIEILGDMNPKTGRATPRFEAMVKLPGQPLNDRMFVKLEQKSAPVAPDTAPSSPDTAQSLTPLWGKAFSDSHQPHHPIPEGWKIANPADITSVVRGVIVACIRAGWSQTKTIQEVFGIVKSGNNPNYDLAREVFQGISRSIN